MVATRPSPAAVHSRTAGDAVTRRRMPSGSRVPTMVARLLLAGMLVVAAAGCADSGDGQAAAPEPAQSSGPQATGPQATGPQATGPQASRPAAGDGTSPTSFGGITTTTVFEVVAAECDPAALAVASLATISPVYSTVDSYGCDGTNAWAWMSPGDRDPDRLLSVLFVDSGGLWRAMDTVAVCATGSVSGIAAEVLASGCAHL